MHFDLKDEPDVEVALEREIEAQGEAAKRAIREYKNTILHETTSGSRRQIETRREVEHAVNHYMQLRRRLDELRGADSR